MEKEQDFYQRLREKMKAWLATREGASSEWGEYLILAPDLFHLLWKLSADPDVPAAERVKLAATIAYFISPFDLIPEAVFGPLGFTDDIAMAAYVLNGLINKTSPALVQKHWAGEDDALDAIQKILAAADRMVGGGMWRRLKKYTRLPG